MSHAWSRTILPRPYIWRLTSLSFVIWPSVCSFDQGEVMAAGTVRNFVCAAGIVGKMERAGSGNLDSGLRWIFGLNAA